MVDTEQLIRDVNQEGYSIETYQDFKKLKSKDKNLIPILLKYLNSTEKSYEKEFFVGCLGKEVLVILSTVTPILGNRRRYYRWKVSKLFLCLKC